MVILSNSVRSADCNDDCADDSNRQRNQRQQQPRHSRSQHLLSDLALDVPRAVFLREAGNIHLPVARFHDSTCAIPRNFQPRQSPVLPAILLNSLGTRTLRQGSIAVACGLPLQGNRRT